MGRIVPWSGLEVLGRLLYAKAGKGSQPIGLLIMLRTYFVQQWFNLSDPGVDLGMAPMPGETTVLRFPTCLSSMIYVA